MWLCIVLSLYQLYCLRDQKKLVDHMNFPMLIIYWPDIQYMVHSYFDPMMALEERFGDLFWIGSKVTKMLDIGHSPQLE